MILHRLAVPGSIIIQDRWINYTASYGFCRYGRLDHRGDRHRPLRARGARRHHRQAARRGRGPESLDRHPQADRRRRRGLRDRRDLQPRDHPGTPLGLPLAGVLVVIFLVALTFLAKRTTFGRHVYAVGGNAEAARRAGINVPRIRILVFMISSGMAAIGGIILAANVNSVDLNFGGGTLLLELDRRGGDRRRQPLRRPRRGAGCIPRRARCIATVSNGLNTAGYSTGIIYIVTGIILLLAVTLDTIARRLQVRSGR